MIDHPFCVKLHYAFQTQTKLYMIMDYCSGGDIGKLLYEKRTLEEEHAKILAAETLLGLESMHKKNIIFRDLKPDNIIIDEDGHALITDFGLAK
jgi:serine/threonine protein kinase